jgi:hypothetical protein
VNDLVDWLNKWRVIPYQSTSICLNRFVVCSWYMAFKVLKEYTNDYCSEFFELAANFQFRAW